MFKIKCKKGVLWWTKFKEVKTSKRTQDKIAGALFKNDPYLKKPVLTTGERKYLIEYWYLTSWKEGECYDCRTLLVLAKNDKEALEKAKHQAPRGAKDFKII